jgi:hypothetical protein
LGSVPLLGPFHRAVTANATKHRHLVRCSVTGLVVGAVNEYERLVSVVQSGIDTLVKLGAARIGVKAVAGALWMRRRRTQIAIDWARSATETATDDARGDGL